MANKGQHRWVISTCRFCGMTDDNLVCTNRDEWSNSHSARTCTYCEVGRVDEVELCEDRYGACRHSNPITVNDELRRQRTIRSHDNCFRNIDRMEREHQARWGPLK